MSSNLHNGHESVTDPDLIVRGREGALNKRRWGKIWKARAPHLDSPLYTNKPITTNKLKYPDNGVILSKNLHITYNQVNNDAEIFQE